MEHSVTLNLPEQVYQAISHSARESGQTPEEVIGKILAHTIAGEDPLLRLAGALSCENRDLGARHDDYLGEEILREVRGNDGG